MPEPILPNPQSSTAGRKRTWAWRFAGLMLVAAVVALVSAFVETKSPLARDVEAIGGMYTETDMDLRSGSLTNQLSGLNDFVFNRLRGMPRRSIGLWFYKGGVSDAWLLEHAAAMHEAPIHYLVLRGAKVTDAGARELAGMSSLIDLDLSGTDVSDGSMPLIAQLPQLHNVNLAKSRVTMDGLSMLQGTRVRRLTIDGDLLTDETVEILNQNGEIFELALRGATPEQIARVAKLKYVRALTLQEVHDESLPALSQLGNLNYLTLEDSGLSKKSTEELKRSLPSLDVRERISWERAEAMGMTQARAATQWLVAIALAIAALPLLLVVALMWVAWRWAVLRLRGLKGS